MYPNVYYETNFLGDVLKGVDNTWESLNDDQTSERCSGYHPRVECHGCIPWMAAIICIYLRMYV